MSYLLIAGLLIYALHLSGRISALENKLKSGMPVSGSQPMPQAPLAEAPQAPGQGYAASQRADMIGEFNTAKTLTVIGAIALVIGIGFFFKYAIDNGWINEWGRIIIGLVVGALFAALGQLWREKYVGYATAMTATGAAIFYLSVLLGNQLYHLYPDAVTAIILVLTSAACYFLALRHPKSAYVQFEAIVAAYLVPMFLFQNEHTQLLLLGYLSILNILVALLSLKKLSAELFGISILFNALNFFVWIGQYSSFSNVGLTFAYLVVSAMVFSAFAAYAFAKDAAAGAQDDGSRLAAVQYLFALFAIVAAYSVFTGVLYPYLSAMLLVYALVFIFGYALVDRLEREALNYSLALSAGFSLVFAAYEQFHNSSDYVLSIAFLAIAAAALLAGRAYKRRELLVIGSVVLVIEMIKALFFDAYPSGAQMFVNPRFGVILLSVLAIALASWFVRGAQGAELRDADKALAGIAALSLWLAATMEILHFYSSNGAELTVSLWTLFFGIIVIMAGSLPAWKILRKVGFALIAIAILKVFLYDSLALETGYRIVAFITLGVILLGVSFYYQRNKDRIKEFLA